MISELSVQNYRSLKDVTLPLGPLTVLIGANGSGKSNVLDVFKLVQQLTTDVNVGTAQAFGKRGGYEEVVWGGQTEREVKIAIDWSDPSSANSEKDTFAVSFNHDVSQDAVFSHERLATHDRQVTRDSQSKYAVFDGSVELASGYSPTGRSALFGANLDGWHSPNPRQSIEGWAFYRFVPTMMRTPQPVKRQYRLAETGENLSAVVHTIFSANDPALNDVVEFLKACVPTVEELRSPITESGETYVALKENGVPRAVGSWGLSDGTLLALALATALLTPEPPTLLAVEAPDIELYPYVMETVAEMLTLASQKTQVIATTHSPYLLEHLPTDSFVVVEKADGATTCRPLKGKRAVKKVAEQLGAGRAWVAGHIGGVP